jgi:hypothetical protein
MAGPRHRTLQFERRLLEHPRAYHHRRMRLALWLYFVILARLPPGQDTVEVEPVQVSYDMGLPEGTVRSWLGHLRRLHYLKTERLNGSLRVRVTRLGLPEPAPKPVPKFFTKAKLVRALGEADDGKLLDEVLKHPDEVIRRALAGTLAVPAEQIRKSRTALFNYLVKRYAEET